MVNYWLGRCYHLSLKGQGAKAISIFKERLEADQNLRKEAQLKLQKLSSDQIANKCFISKKYAEFLRAALS